MNNNIYDWAIRHGVTPSAFKELRAIMGVDVKAHSDGTPVGATETLTQSLVRLEAARAGVKLWRNNVGVLKDTNGRPVRYGLANDSKQLNEVIKSADLIGWRPVLITDVHVSKTIAQFVSRECKRPGWVYSGNDHELAQLRWAEAITADGGDAQFCNGEGTL